MEDELLRAAVVRPSCSCWEVKLPPDEIEPLLLRLRKRFPGSLIQVFAHLGAPNAKAVELIAAQTLAAEGAGSTLAEKPEVDLLLRIASTRQIGEAFKRAGYKGEGKRLFMVVASHGAASRKLEAELARDKHYAKTPERGLTAEDLDWVERAALLAARL